MQQDRGDVGVEVVGDLLAFGRSLNQNQSSVELEVVGCLNRQ